MPESECLSQNVKLWGGTPDSRSIVGGVEENNEIWRCEDQCNFGVGLNLKPQCFLKLMSVLVWATWMEPWNLIDRWGFWKWRANLNDREQIWIPERFQDKSQLCTRLDKEKSNLFNSSTQASKFQDWAIKNIFRFHMYYYPNPTLSLQMSG